MKTLPQTLSLSLVRLANNALVQYATALVDGIPQVSQYADIQPKISDAAPTIAAFGTAVATAAQGGQAVRQQRDALRPQVLAIVRQWSEYALETTPGNLVLWATAHFHLTKGQRQPRPLPQAPSKFIVLDGGAKGSLELRQNTQSGIKAYVYEYALLPADGQAPVWHYCLGNKASCLLTGLQSGQAYLLRCAAWNGSSPMLYSVVETRYVQ